MKNRRSAADVEAARSRTAAVITAFRPGAEFARAVDAAMAQCHHVFVVDNTPTGTPGVADVLPPREQVTVLADGTNRGLAVALNQGIRAAGEVEFLFLLDQDSVVGEGMVAGLVGHLDEDATRGIASPAPWDQVAKRYLDPRASRRPVLAEMPVVITSAMLVRREAFASTAGMREEFFVDCVDQDFCLQVRRGGWSIVQDRGLLLPHSLGESRWYGFGPLKIRATHHATWRLYWVARNGIILSREYRKFDPSWTRTNLLILAYWLATVALFEAPRLRRLRTMVRGIRDGRRGIRDARFLPAGAA